MKNFISKSGHKVIIRYPTMDDLKEMTRYINTLSTEDTFIRFSGEQMSLDDERKFLETALKEIENKDMIYLCCFIRNTMVASAGIERNKVNKKRSLHIGTFGISVAQEHRGEGIGYTLMETILEEAKKLEWLRIVELDVFGNNEAAVSLYKKFGFKEAGRIPGYYLHRGVYVDGVKMYKEI